MKKLFTLTVSSGIIGLILMPSVKADCVVRSRVVVNPVVSNVITNHAVVVKKEVALATVVPIAVYQAIPLYVPTYAASYQPGYSPGYPVTPPTGVVPAPATMSNQDMKAIMDSLERINRRLDALESGKVVPPPSAPKPPIDPFNPPKEKTSSIKSPTVFMNKCASCHQRGKEKDGGDFVLLETDGRLATLTDKQILGVTKRAYSGTMPPKSSKIEALTDAEVGEIMEFFDTKK